MTILFSTVKSIRGYRCAQFFCHVLSDLLFVRCMQRESHSHGAYEDCIREIGASETIVTDNFDLTSGSQLNSMTVKISRESMDHGSLLGYCLGNRGSLYI